MNALHRDMKVRYKADPSTVGWVIAISGQSARVFINGSMRLVPVAELEPAPGLTEMSPRRIQDRLNPAKARASPD